MGESRAEYSTSSGGTYRRECSRCSSEVRHGTGLMCSDCIRETAGSSECPICTEYSEEICGYHATCLWYCPDCGYIRPVGNRPARPGTEETVGCYNHPPFDGESHRMIRLTYTSTVEDRLWEYVHGGVEA